MAKARLPAAKLLKMMKTTKMVKPPIGASPAVMQPSARVTIPDALHHDARKLWDYMSPHMPPSLVTAIDPLVLRVFELPRVRSIKWRKTWHKRTLINDWRQVAGLLLHLVGAEHDGMVKCCTFCRRGEGPFEGCQVLPTSHEARNILRSCANCMFILRSHHCSIKTGWDSKRPYLPNKAPLPAATPVAELAADIASSSSSNKTNMPGNDQNNKRAHDEVSDDGTEEANASRRRSERFKGRYLEMEAKTKHTKKLVTVPLPSREKSTTSADALRARTTITEPSSAALMSSGLPTHDSLLEMEEWEIAPGRIRENGMGQPDSEWMLPSHPSPIYPHLISGVY